MNLGKLSVRPRIPEALMRLEEIAYNMWWSWNSEAQTLYGRIDPELWDAVNHNPVKLLQRVDQVKLDSVASDKDFLSEYQNVLDAFDTYMAPDTPSWYSARHSDKKDQVIAYFSAEFGLHEALPIYSGGLGILSGDHCKAASDLGLPFIGVGFLYPQGYFTQRIDQEGHQLAEYEKIDFTEVPARPALDPQGNELLINVDLPGRTVYAKIWKIQVGRIPIYLMDTDVPRNAPQDRELSARLYGGDREMRISQEIVLGIGGVRAVFALGYNPSVWHMNEGHSAFLGLERARRKVQEAGLTFEEAVESVRANTLFTTHTPVPAGNDAFAFELVDKFFWQYWGQLGLNRDRFIEFARQDLTWGAQYSMTVLALRLSGFANGVSQLHGEVSRAMWRFLWPQLPTDEVPIGAITNGVHTQTWLAPELKRLYSRYVPDNWQEHIEEAETWQRVDEIPDQELWSAHLERKIKMINLVRRRVRQQYIRHGESIQATDRANHILNPHALTIGFARRFATYKRAMLIFHDIERVTKLLNDPDRPIQIIFSGKAHPDDEPGKALIQQVYALSQTPEFAGKIIFVENYDVNIARYLISGVDLWLNTPRRPREASGTSGQKAAMSGVPNFSILDGWWEEGFNGKNGWAIGEDREYKDLATQDDADSYSLYTTLEEEIIPAYFDRDEESGIPLRWLKVMKESIRSNAPRFSMRRMVIEYTERYYLPAAQQDKLYQAEGWALAKQMVNWRSQIKNRWQNVRVELGTLPEDKIIVGDPIQIQAKVWLNGAPPSDIVVELVSGLPVGDNDLKDPIAVPMTQSGQEGDALLYSTAFTPARSGPLVVGVRICPHKEHEILPIDPLVRWA